MNEDIRRIGVRKFQQNLHKELAITPLIITKDGKDYKKVVDVDTPTFTKSELEIMLEQMVPELVRRTLEDKVTTENTHVTTPIENVSNLRLVNTCQAPATVCKNPGFQYQVTFMADDGEKKKDLFLCSVHLKKAKDSGMEVQEV